MEHQFLYADGVNSLKLNATTAQESLAYLLCMHIAASAAAAAAKPITAPN